MKLDRLKIINENQCCDTVSISKKTSMTRTVAEMVVEVFVSDSVGISDEELTGFQKFDFTQLANQNIEGKYS
ncbi:unnamed protein product [Heterobilharzia americana]|nr:unnamed protein product [Heterobilharzia americana]